MTVHPSPSYEERKKVADTCLTRAGAEHGGWTVVMDDKIEEMVSLIILEHWRC
jgi:hypothetical protein